MTKTYLKDETYDVGHMAEVSCSAMVTATVEQVNQASREWAADLGWGLIRRGEATLTFSMTRRSSPFASLQLEVVTARHRNGQTGVSFVASMQVMHPGLMEDLRRVSECFAHGVCHELALRGAEISPSDLALPRQERERQKSNERWRANAQRVLLGIWIPAVAIPTILVHERLLTALTINAWLGLALSISPLVRWRILGARAPFLLFFVLFIFAAMMFGTLVFVLLMMHRLG